MAPKRRWRRILRISAIALLVLVAGMAAFVQIRQHILRWRAERLLADIRELQLGKSAWADAQRIMTRWGAWGHYDGSCTETRCSYHILISAFGPPSWMSNTYYVLGPRVFRILRIRSYFVGARLEVIDGAVWAKDYFVELDVPERIDGQETDLGLEASADTTWRTEEFAGHVSAKHPEYFVGHLGHCEGCKAVWVRFTPFADNGTVNNLMDFNLDCLTRWKPCRDHADVMPQVWSQVLAEERDREAAQADGQESK